MERTNMTKRKSHFGMIVLFFLAAFLFSIDAQAQYFPPLVSEAQAQSVLDNEIPVQETILNSLTPGTTTYQTAERKYHMYVHTWETLLNGESLEDALIATFSEFALGPNGHKGDTDEFTLNQKPVSSYGDSAFDDLVDLLEN
ncbi:MAG: hypothetical protein AAGG75_24585 [Bacteroidota bacterium]